VCRACYAPGVKSLSISIVGAGRLGTALAERLDQAGYRISQIIARTNKRSMANARALAEKLQAQPTGIREAKIKADLVWFCVPDEEVSHAANAFPRGQWTGKIAVHSSGVLTSEALESLRKQGAHVASVHPLMTFVHGSVPQLAGVPFAIEGDQAAVRVAKEIVHNLEGHAIHQRKQDKVAYHAFATMVCPLLVSLLAAAEKTAALAGMSAAEARRRMMPILRQTMANYERLGPANAFSGPIVRGDTETIRQHLAALAAIPPASGAYTALAKSALEYLPSRNASGIRPVLDEFTQRAVRRNGKRTSPASRRSTRRR
jgi:predicted short-subunit dehydrogenase-like oxidoreductase (DUF2520 family)